MVNPIVPAYSFPGTRQVQVAPIQSIMDTIPAIYALFFQTSGNRIVYSHFTLTEFAKHSPHFLWSNYADAK